MKKLIFMLFMVLVVPLSFGAYGLRQWNFRLINEVGDPITESCAITIYNASSGADDSAAVYTKADAQTAIGTTNDAVTDGEFEFWYAPLTCDIGVVRTNADASTTTIRLYDIAPTDHTIVVEREAVTLTTAAISAATISGSLSIDDAVALALGTGTDATFAYDGTNNDLDLTSTTALDEFSLGATGDGFDFIWWGTTAGDYVIFDYSADKVLFEDIGLMIGDSELVEFGDTTASDLDLYYDGTKNQLELLDNDGDATLQILGFEAKEARLILAADEDDDATDQWQVSVDTSGVLAFGNDAVADTFTDYVTFAAGTGLITLKEGETVSNNTDDTVIFTSNDEAMTVQIMGVNTNKSAILSLDADGASDNADTWTHTVADGGAYTIANEGTATLTINELVAFAGQTRKHLIHPSDVTLDSANPPSLTFNGTAAQWEWASLEFDGNGANGDDLCFITWVVPDGYVVDSGRLNVYWSYDTAETDNDDVVFDMTVNATALGLAAAGGEVLDTAGTAFTQGDTNITNGDGDEGKLIMTPLNFEVEDIAVDDVVTIMFWVDESESDLDNSGTLDVHYFEIEYESSE